VLGGIGKDKTRRVKTKRCKAMTEIDKEPCKENEIWCAYCGPGWKAEWELFTDDGGLFACDNHHFVLRQIHTVRLERLIGEEKWNEVVDLRDQDLEEETLQDLGDWKDLIDHHGL
jgi:hypothetical protein